MMPNNPYQKYRQNQVETATPEMLVLMLYNGSLKFIKEAQEAIQAKEIEKANNRIVRVQKIVSELMLSLKLEEEVGKSLYLLYDYMHTRLVEANIKKDARILLEVEAMLGELKDAWQGAVSSNKKKEKIIS